MTEKFDIQNLINNCVIIKSEAIEEFYTLLEKENEARYFRRSYLINFNDNGKLTGLSKQEFIENIRGVDFPAFVSEACLHPSVTVDVNPYMISKVKTGIELFLSFVEKGNLFTVIDVADKNSPLSIHTFELELGVYDGLPTFTCSICRPEFSGFTKDEDTKSIVFDAMGEFQIVDYLEIELF